MRIEITKSILMRAHEASTTLEGDDDQFLFPAGEYPATLTPEGKIEVVSKMKIIASFSFSQFRERISLGEFILLEA